jgi:hypothetical protein
VLKLTKYVAMGLLATGSVMANNPGTKTETVNWTCTVNLIGQLANNVEIDTSASKEFTNITDLKDHVTQVGTISIADNQPRNIGYSSSIFKNTLREIEFKHNLYIGKSKNGSCAMGWSVQTDSNNNAFCAKYLPEDGVARVEGVESGAEYKLFLKVEDTQDIVAGPYTLTTQLSVSPAVSIDGAPPGI